MLISTVWLGLIGLIDDYIKVFKKDKEGLAGRFKIIGQVGLGLIIGLTMYFHEGITIKEEIRNIDKANTEVVFGQETKSLKTSIPFVKNNEFDYTNLVNWMGKNGKKYAWIVFVLVVIFIVTAVSNGANMTDGLDGLAILPTVMVAVGLGMIAYVTGRVDFASYLNIAYIAGAGEMVVFCGAIAGAGLGFLWFNTYPAMVFMGDVGALALGAALGIVAVIIRQELVLFIMGGVFVIETLSVIIQVASFKLRGKRVFKMAPIHHHFELSGWPEPRVIVRFWIITAMLVLFGLATLKLR